MSTDPLRMAIIIGSVRPGRFGPTAAGWFAELACRRGELDVDVIDLAEARLPDIPEAGDAHPPRAVRNLAPWLAGADAFVVVTPEYNGSFPGSVKAAIDWYRDEWAYKPVAFVSYGADGGVHAVDHLRQVFASLKAVPIHDSIRLPDHHGQVDEHGRVTDPVLSHAAGVVLDQLTWWAGILRQARARRLPAAVAENDLRTDDRAGLP